MKQFAFSVSSTETTLCASLGFRLRKPLMISDCSKRITRMRSNTIRRPSDTRPSHDHFFVCTTKSGVATFIVAFSQVYMAYH
jgi:hypothetical protein